MCDCEHLTLVTSSWHNLCSFKCCVCLITYLPVYKQQSASFGPFDRQVVILNTDGKTFTLLQNPQAMRLKKAGYIEDRKFIIQPTQKEIDDALEGENFGDAIKGIFGGGGDKSGDVAAIAEVSESVSSESSPSSVVEEETPTSVEEVVVSESQPESVDAAAVESN